MQCIYSEKIHCIFLYHELFCILKEKEVPKMANTYAEFLRNKKSKEIVQLKKENEPDMQEQSPYTDLTEPKK